MHRSVVGRMGVSSKKTRTPSERKSAHSSASGPSSKKIAMVGISRESGRRTGLSSFLRHKYSKTTGQADGGKVSAGAGERFLPPKSSDPKETPLESEKRNTFPKNKERR